MYPTRYRPIVKTIEHVSQKLKRTNAIERKTLNPNSKTKSFTQVEVDLLATFSMNDFVPKSWVWIRCTPPSKRSSFSWENRWKLITRGENATGNRYVRADAWNAAPRRSVFNNRGFSRWSKGRGSDISRTRGNRFHFQWNGCPRATLENAFSPLILAQGGEGLSVGPRCDVISFVRGARLGLIVILEVVGRYSVP